MLRTATLKRALNHLRPLETDRRLLKRFADSREESAFAELVRRHGALVHGTARRILGDPHAADDTFQATFLLLARKAGSVGWHDSVASWLHAVAVRLALKARSKLRRPVTPPTLPESEGPEPEPVVPLLREEVRGILDEELSRLPRRLARPLILCYLQGLTRDEAAESLGLRLGQFKHRLQQARDTLRDRLDRRGVGLPTVGLGVALACDTVTAATVSATTRTAITGLACGGWMIPPRLLVAAVVTVGTGLAALTALQPPETLPPDPVPPEAVERMTRPAGELPAGVVRQFGDSRLRTGARIDHLAFSPDGKTLASWGRFMYVHDRFSLWDAATGEEIRTAITDEHRIGAMGFAADGRGYVVLKNDGRMRPNTGFGIWEFTAEDFELPPPDPRRNNIGIRVAGGLPAVPEETFGPFAISPDGKWLAGVRTGAAHPTPDVAVWPVRAAESGEALKTEATFGGIDPADMLRFSPDGKTVLVFGKVGDGDETQPLAVWDWQSGKKLRDLSVPKRHQGSSVMISPDGKTLAVGHKDGAARLIDLATGEEIRRVAEHVTTLSNGKVRTGVGMVGFTPDGKRLITGGWDEKVFAWDVASGERVAELERHYSWPEAFAASPDGSRVATSGQDSLIRIWDTKTWKSAVEQTGHTHTVWDADITRDSRFAVTNAWDGTARVWELATGREVARFPGLTDAHFTPDGTAVVGAKNGTFHMFGLQSGKAMELPEPLREAGGGVKGFSPDGKTLLTHTDSEAVLRSWPTGEVRHRLDGGKLSDGFFSPDGRTLVTTYSSGKATAWDVASGEKIRDLDVKGSMYDHMAAFTPDGKGFVIETRPNAGRNDAVVLFDTRNWARKRTFASSDAGLATHNYLLSLAMSPDGRVVAAGSHDGTVTLFEVATGQVRGRLFGHREGVAALEFTPDGRHLLTGGLDSLVYLWDATPRWSDSAEGTEDAAKRWRSISDTDAEAAYRAMVWFISRPDEALPLLRQELRPAIGPEAETVRAILSRLGSPKFAVRERASADLEKLGEPAVAVVGAELGGVKSAEAKRRAERFIAEFEVKDGTPRRLRQIRAFEILEHLRTPEAEALLKELAAGQPGAWITEQAEAALKRLVVSR